MANSQYLRSRISAKKLKMNIIYYYKYSYLKANLLCLFYNDNVLFNQRKFPFSL